MTPSDPAWQAFEDQVAQLFRAAGARAYRNYPLGGAQIDVFVEQTTAIGPILRLVVECKYYAKPVGLRTAQDFSVVTLSILGNRLADRALMVSRAGYTKEARQHGQDANIDMLEFDELQNRLLGVPAAATEPARQEVVRVATTGRLLHDQLGRTAELSDLEFQEMRTDLMKDLERIKGSIDLYLSPGMTLAQRRARFVLTTAEDQIERAIDALDYLREVTLLSYSEPGQQSTPTAELLPLIRERNNARAALRARLRAIEDLRINSHWET